LVGQQGVVAALLADEAGSLIAVVPTPRDPFEAEDTADWAGEQIERFSSLRNLLGEKEFSMLFEPKETPVRAHCHLQSLAGHVLLVFFADRDFLGRVRLSSREVSSRLEHLFLES
jgi:hypothetical protein